MALKDDIKATAEGIVAVLEDNRFFEENVFIDKSKLLNSLEIKMQLKFEDELEYILSESELMDIINHLFEEAVDETLMGLVDKGLVSMSVNEDGEITYQANGDYEKDITE